MTELSDEEKEEKAKELDKSALFDVHVWSEHPEVNKAVDELYSMLKELPDGLRFFHHLSPYLLQHALRLACP